MILKIKEGFIKLFHRIPENKRMPFIVLCAVALIFLIAIPEITGATKEHEAETETAAEETYEEYVSQTEERLGALISSIEGAGKAKVMLTLECGEENVYAYDINAEKTEYVILKSNSTENGMLLKIIKPKIRGVAVVCEGGESAVVRRDIINAISSSLGVSSTKISIAKMEEGANND